MERVECRSRLPWRRYANKVHCRSLVDEHETVGKNQIRTGSRHDKSSGETRTDLGVRSIPAAAVEAAEEGTVGSLLVGVVWFQGHLLEQRARMMKLHQEEVAVMHQGSLQVR